MKQVPLIISIVALFFSLGGIGLAASHYLITSTSQIKPSILRELQGHRGEAGVQGPEGVSGVADAQQFTTGPELVPLHGEQLFTEPCPPNSVVLGGGYETDYGVIVLGSRPDDNEWKVDAVNNTDHNVYVSLWAICT